MPDSSFPSTKGREEAIYVWYTPRQVSLQLDLPSLTFYLECAHATLQPPLAGFQGGSVLLLPL